MQNQSSRLICLGFGYVASHLAPLASAAGWQVVGTTRRELQNEHATLIVPDEVGDLLKDARAVLVSVPPGEGQAWALELCQHVKPAWLGYLSSTGVYGDHDGAWVDEQSELRTLDARTEARRAAEQEWQEQSAHIFRLAGIYGPGRNALLQLKSGTARRIDKPDHVFSRTHVTDIARMLWASIQVPSPGEVYNVADDTPAPAHEVVTYAAQLLNMQPPPMQPFEEATLSPMMQSFYSANRRVANTKIKQELGIELAYPSYKKGLNALVQDMKNET